MGRIPKFSHGIPLEELDRLLSQYIDKITPINTMIIADAIGSYDNEDEWDSLIGKPPL